MRKPLTLMPAALALALLAAACGTAPGAGRSAPAASSAPASPSSQTPAPQTPAAPAATRSSTAAAGPLTWANVGTSRPLWIAANRPGLAADPAGHPADLAFCLTGPTGGIRVSRDGGRTWATIPTAGVVAATAGTRYPVRAAAGGAPACASAVADPAHARTVYASFAAGSAKYGMPPVYNIPVYTTDGGVRWQVVPTPTGSAAGGFGQFALGASAVRAVFGRPLGVATGSAFAVTETRDGGARWRVAAPSCPAQGPCLAWGPAASGTGSCAMHGYAQPILASADGGRTWAALPAPAGSPPSALANGCGQNQLVALSARRAALVASGAPLARDALRVTDNGGRTWRTVTLPALPGHGATQGLQMLPDGALLAPVFGEVGAGRYAIRFDLLQPGAGSWCPVPGIALPGSGTNPAGVQAVGGRLWWIGSASRHQAAAAHSVPLGDVRC